MAAIAARGFADKNEIIDWLREQGFAFARASWLERIHKNGGKPIYAGDVTRRRQPGGAAASEPSSRRRPPQPPAPAPQRPKPGGQRQRRPPRPTRGDGEAARRRQGLPPALPPARREIKKAVPGLAILPKPGYVTFSAPAEFAALTLHATELRLGLDLGDHPFDDAAEVQAARPGPAITHMLVLTDARQVNDELISLMTAAHAAPMLKTWAFPQKARICGSTFSHTVGGAGDDILGPQLG